MTEQEQMKAMPYTLVKWNVVKADIDFNNPTKLDTILLLTKEMSKYHINHFQTTSGAKYLNKLFNLKENIKNFDYGVQSIWFAGCDGDYSSRIPRVRIEYKTGNWQHTYNVMIGYTQNMLNIKERDKSYRLATDAEIDAVIKYMQTLINDRKAEIAAQEKNPTFEEFKKLCLEVAQEYLKENENKLQAKIKYGKSAKDDTNAYAIVIEYPTKQNSIFSQVGYVRIGQNEYGEFSLSCTANGCGGYGVKLTDWKEYEKTLKEMIGFIIN